MMKNAGFVLFALLLSSVASSFAAPAVNDLGETPAAPACESIEENVGGTALDSDELPIPDPSAPVLLCSGGYCASDLDCGRFQQCLKEPGHGCGICVET